MAYTQTRNTHSVARNIILAFFVMFVLAAVPVYAENWYVMNVEGTIDFGKAQEMLAKVNALRASKGLSSLVLDQSLTETAMYRAAECAVDFSHTRPNGDVCFSANAKMFGENIAAGNSTAEGTYQQWYHSSGHYQNMIDPDWRSIGIGCFNQGGLYCWVQCFSSYSATPYTETAKQNIVAEILIAEDGKEVRFNLNQLSQGETLNLKSGETFTLIPGKVNPGFGSRYVEFAANSFNWTSSDPAVAEVNADGKVIAKNAGETVISASAKRGTKTAKITVSVKKYISGTEIEIESGAVYNGSAHTPKVVIKDGSYTLKEGSDYSLSYSNNKNAGLGAIKITGKGQYNGSVQKTFVIETAPISSVNLSAKKYVYNGSVRRPTVTVKNSSGTVLSANNDYTVTYKNNVKVGTATVVINGTGNYTGALSKTFTIIPKKPVISSVTAGQKNFMLRWKKQTTETSGFVIQYARNNTFTSSKKLVTLKKNTYTARRVSGLLAGKKYYVRIEVFKTVGGKRYYSNWSDVKIVTPKK